MIKIVIFKYFDILIMWFNESFTLNLTILGTLISIPGLLIGEVLM